MRGPLTPQPCGSGVWLCKGPTFREEVDGVDSLNEALIAVNRRSSEIWVDGRMEQREQFPLMLAWALTIHKAQGLTLDRVVIDAGDDEKSVGLLFVAMTRVRHPQHIAFSPWPSIDRVTSTIARKPALKQRKQHEQTLRGLALQTARRFSRQQPQTISLTKPSTSTFEAYTDLSAELLQGTCEGTGNVQFHQFGPKRSTSAAAPTPPRHHLFDGGTVTVSSGAANKARASVKSSSGASDLRAAARPSRRRPLKQSCLMQAMQTARANRVTEREYEQNTAAVAALGLPILVDVNFDAHSRFEPTLPLPESLIASRTNGLVLQARIVDFWTGSQETRANITSWLQHLGFDVVVTDDCTQLGPACGYVAARATNLMFESISDWRSVDVSDAVDQKWIDLGNEVLEFSNADYLRPEHIYTLAQRFREHIAEDAWPCEQWPLTVGSLDWVARQIAEGLMKFAVGNAIHTDSCSRAFYVTNTQDCRRDGEHWILVAILMSWQGRGKRVRQEDSSDEEVERLARLRAGKARATRSYLLPTVQEDSSDEEAERLARMRAGKARATTSYVPTVWQGGLRAPADAKGSETHGDGAKAIALQRAIARAEAKHKKNSKFKPCFHPSTFNASVEIVDYCSVPSGSDILLIQAPWLGLILDGRKTWEIRGQICRKSDGLRIYLALPGAGGVILGSVNFVKCCGPLSQQEYTASRERHLIAGDDLPYASTYAWEFNSPKRFRTPVTYRQKKGVVTWQKME